MKKCFLGVILSLLVLPSFAQYNTAKSSIQILDVKYDYREDGENGMRINYKATVSGAIGHKIEVIAFFYYKNGRANCGNKDGYRTKSGQTCTSNTHLATLDNITWDSGYLFLPYSALNHNKGRNDLKYKLCLRDMTTNYRTLAYTDMQPFYANFKQSIYNVSTGQYSDKGEGSDDIHDIYDNQSGEAVDNILINMVVDSIAWSGDKQLRRCSGVDCTLKTKKGQYVKGWSSNSTSGRKIADTRNTSGTELSIRYIGKDGETHGLFKNWSSEQMGYAATLSKGYNDATGEFYKFGGSGLNSGYLYVTKYIDGETHGNLILKMTCSDDFRYY